VKKEENNNIEITLVQQNDWQANIDSILGKDNGISIYTSP